MGNEENATDELMNFLRMMNENLLEAGRYLRGLKGNPFYPDMVTLWVSVAHLQMEGLQVLFTEFEPIPLSKSE